MCCTSEIKALQLSEVTNALLDSCSQGTFVTERILKELNVTAVKTSINVKTLKSNQKVSSALVDGIMVLKQVLSTRDQILG